MKFFAAKVLLFGIFMFLKVPLSFGLEMLFPPDGVSYSQRGILRHAGGDLALTSYVSVKNFSAVMHLKSSAGTLAKIGISKNGNIFICEGSPMFPKEFVEKFAVRDFLLILGFTSVLDPKKMKVMRDENRLPVSISEGGYTIKFLPFKTIKALNFPMPSGIKIESEGYMLEFGQINLLKVPQ